MENEKKEREVFALTGRTLKANSDVNEFIQKMRKTADPLSDSLLTTDTDGESTGAYFIAAIKNFSASKDDSPAIAYKSVLRLEHAQNDQYITANLIASMIRMTADAQNIPYAYFLKEIEFAVIAAQNPAMACAETAPLVDGYTFESQGTVSLKGTWCSVSYDGHTWTPERMLSKDTTSYSSPENPNAVLLVTRTDDTTAEAVKYIPLYEADQ